MRKNSTSLEIKEGERKEESLIRIIEKLNITEYTIFKSHNSTFENFILQRKNLQIYKFMYITVLILIPSKILIKFYF